jgi:hypothetical protein
MKPLSHHEILGWIEPFARRGLQADLAASDRNAGRLAFRPAEFAVAPTAGTEASVLARLQLQRLEHDGFRLTRQLTLPGGGIATLAAEGRDAATLLEAIERVPPARQFLAGPGFELALDHEIEPGEGDPAARLRLVQGVARLDGFRLELDVSGTVKGVPGKLELKAEPARDLDLPEDLLAVLGWSWTRLTRFGDAWRAELRLRGEGLARGRLAEARLAEAVRHLAATFAEPPARFHERQHAARWRVTLRRAVPLLVSLALIGGAASVSKLGLYEDASLRMVLFNLPPLLMIAIFCLPEMPRIEIPPLPRRPRAASWRAPGG